jgi:hypothetical protein
MAVLTFGLAGETMKKVTLRTLNNYLKKKGVDKTEECTHYKGNYYWLHICKNGNPAPMACHPDAREILRELKIRIG